MRQLYVFALMIYSAFSFAQQPLNPGFGEDTVTSTNIDGSKVIYLKRGEGETLLIYHNTGIFLWQEVIETMSVSNKVIVNGPMPLRGAPSGAENLIKFIENLGIAPVHLVAHSMSARQALTLASTNPQLLRSLTLIEPAGAPTEAGVIAQLTDPLGPSYRCDLSEELQNSIIVDQSECLLQVQINEPGFLRNAPTELVRHLVESEENNTIPDSNQITAFPETEAPPLTMLFPPICDELKSIDFPVLFIRGELTPSVIQNNLDAYESCLPPHQSVIISGSAHYPFVYNPGEFSNVLNIFLSSQ